MKFTSHYGYSEAEYTACKSIIDATNEKTVKLIAWITFIISLTLALVGGFVPVINNYAKIYRSFNVIFGCYLVLLRYCAPLKRNVTVQVYVMIFITIEFGAMLAYPLPGEKAVVYPVLLVLIPILFIDNAKRMSKVIFVISVLYSIGSLYFKEGNMAIYDIFCSTYIGVVSILAHYICNIKFVRSIIQEKQMELALEAYKEVQKQLENKMKIDQLTGLYNRETFIDIVSKGLQYQGTEKNKMVIGILDVDHFKLINDTFGHQTGDETIIQISKVLRRVLSPNTEIARLGGDEYIFVLNKITKVEEVNEIIRKVLESLNGLSIVEGMKIEASIGLAFVDQQDIVFDTVYNKADRALYMAKKSGRNCFCYYDN